MKDYSGTKFQNNNLRFSFLTKWISSFLIILGLLFFPQHLTAQTTEYELIDQFDSAEIDASGQTSFYKEYTYDATYLPRISFQVPLMGQEISRYQVGVREEGAEDITYLTEAASGVNGTFQVIVEDEMAEFTITYPLADEKTSFVIEYILDGLVTNYTDTAYWVNQLALHPDLKGKEVDFELVLPGSVSEEDDFKVWVHGYPFTQQERENDSGQTRKSFSFPYETNNEGKLQVNAIFPVGLTPNNENKLDVSRKEAIITHEDALDQQARQASQRARNQLRWIFILFVLIPLLGSAGLLWFFLRKRNSLTPISLKENKSISSPPENFEPPLVKQVIYNQGPDANDLTAALLEIACKGYLKLTPVQVAKRSQTQTRSGYTIKISRVDHQNNTQLLTNYERQVYQLFAPADKDSHTLEEMVVKVTHNKALRREKEGYWQKFCDALILKSVAAKDAGKNYKGPLLTATSLWLLISLITFVWMIYYALNQGMTSWLGFGLPLSILNIIFLVALIILVARHQFMDVNQLEQRKSWEAFRYLLRHSNEYDLPSQADIVQWEKNLIYAVALNTTETIQQSFTHQFDLDALESKSLTTNQELYRFHGSIANVLQPSIREFLGVIHPTSKLKNLVKSSQ